MATNQTTRYYENFDMQYNQEVPQNTNMTENVQTNPQTSQEQPDEAMSSLNAPNDTSPSPLPQRSPFPSSVISDEQMQTILPSSTQTQDTLLQENENSNTSSSSNSNLQNNMFAPEDSTGEITVQAYTARGARPVPEAAVIISKNQNGKENVVSFALTDADGRTSSISVPAPKKADSQAPSEILPFADYDITIRHPLFYTVTLKDVQVFGSEQTIQTVEMVPLPEFVNELDTRRNIIIPKQNL